MDSSRVVSTNGDYDLSNVSTLKDLREEIKFLKASLKKNEEELENRFRQLPQKIIKVSADNLLPSFLNNLIASGAWKMLLGSLGMFANPFSSKLSFKKTILGTAKKIGLFALVKGAYNMWSNKTSGKVAPQPNLKRAQSITTLKAQKVK